MVRVHVPTEDYWDVYYALMLAMREELEKEGIPLTYGTSRVHLDRPQNA